MCGIAGMYAYGRADLGPSHELLAAMARTMVHRGPDDEGIYLSPDRRLGFAFRRLAIVDLSASGHQPMSNEDGTVWLVFNGEIYNHAEHRTPLEAKGHVYKGRSDSETILHLYEEYGEDCVHHLRGMFAFAIWDARRRKLFLARDRVGIKPLYYAFAQGVFLFGSEIKSILACPDIARAIDYEALHHYLTFMIPPAPLTMFEGVRKLAAGWRMTIDSGGNVRQDRYWDAIVPTPSARSSDAEYAERVLAMLDESVRMRMMSDVPIGVFLSGGLDSSLLSALMARASGARINTFSVGFEQYEDYNELKYAREIAARLGANHRETVISHRDALDYVPSLVHSQDEPLADWVCIPLYFVSKLVRDSGVIVAQVGEGADELFCGYPLYLASLSVERLWPVLSRVPRWAWALGSRLGSQLRTAGVRGGRKLERMMAVLQGDGRFWGGALAISDAEKACLLATPFWTNGRHFQSSAVLDRIYGEIENAKPEADALERMIYFELKQRLAELLLMRVDKITMSNSIEARVPYLDHRLVEFAMGIPSGAKIRGLTTKAIVKRAAAGLVPPHIINRPKQGFSAPVAEWFRGELADEVRGTLAGGELVRRGYLNRAAVSALVREHQERRADRSVQLWNLYNLEAWHRHWIN